MSLLRPAILALALLLGVWQLGAAELAVPRFTGHVADQTATLTPEQQTSLEQMLAAFEARKGAQLAVLIVPSTQPEPIEQFALRVAEQWKLGRKKVDDGLLLVVARDDHAVRIEVGYGLEGAMPDAISKRIISEAMLPHFRQNDLYGGIAEGMGQIMRVVDGEPLPPAPAGGAQAQDGFLLFLPFMLILALAMGTALRSTLGRPLGSVLTGFIVGVVSWLVLGTLFTTLLAGLAAAAYTLVGGFMPHGPGMRGGRGGGFSGGGGGFGGGGASGHW